MKIVFYGTSEFAAEILTALAARHTVAGVVCQPDRPSGRGMKLTPPPVKVAALERGIPVYQPRKASSREALQWLQAIGPDLGVAASYGQILSAEVLAIPRYGMINAHASLLPKFRGASPIQAAILAGETETGVSIIQMTERMDQGPILARRSIPIGEETAGELSQKLARLGAELVLETIEQIDAGRAVAVPQDHRLATYTRPLSKADGLIDWRRSAEHIQRQVRAMQPWPGAYGFLKLRNGSELRVTVWSVEVVSHEAPQSVPVAKAEGKCAGAPGDAFVSAESHAQRTVPDHCPRPVQLGSEYPSQSEKGSPAGITPGAKAEGAVPRCAANKTESRLPPRRSCGAIEIRDGSIVVVCGSGAVRIVSIQPSGGRKLATRDFLRGRASQIGEGFVCR